MMNSETKLKPRAEGTDVDRIKHLIAEIDQLVRRQTALEAERTSLAAMSTGALGSTNREIAIAQDLLLASLQRISKLDDDITDARAELRRKTKDWDLSKATIMDKDKIYSGINAEIEKTEGLLRQQKSLLDDLQRRLLLSGSSAEEILKQAATAEKTGQKHVETSKTKRSLRHLFF